MNIGEWLDGWMTGWLVDFPKWLGTYFGKSAICCSVKNGRGLSLSPSKWDAKIALFLFGDSG
jgi:hypothetical protein